MCLQPTNNTGGLFDAVDQSDAAQLCLSKRVPLEFERSFEKTSLWTEGYDRLQIAYS
jgi:hypothetical protein